jgi:Domain of unknown function (DUF4111)/Nucleotidyltransferase domain
LGSAHSEGVPASRSIGATVPSAASDAEALGFAELLARSCGRAIGETVAGVILHGSLTLGDYVPGRSDVDLLVVVDDPLTDTQFTALTEAVAALRPRAPGRVDLRVVTRQAAAAPTPAPPLDASIELTPGSGSELSVERRHVGERDLVVEFSMCRAHGRSLLGAAPAELLGEVPAEWLLAVGDAQLADWEAIGDDPPHAELTVLTTCRIWRLAEEGRHGSKTAAGAWALRRDPTLTVVRAALARRCGESNEPLDPAQVAKLLSLVRARLAQAGNGAD